MINNEIYRYHEHKYNQDNFLSNDMHRNLVRDCLIDAVDDRINMERPFAALLSGGLDSSLICGI
jgi:asparagine synthetase B (glutamine-hydrolysing)